ncbi:MAG: M1 family metallopeptidase [Parvularculaceae bacterium]
MRQIYLAALALCALSPAAIAAENEGRDILPENATPVSYSIAIEPDIAAMNFKGTARLNFKVTKKTDRITVNALDLDIEKATLDNGEKARIETDNAAQRATFIFAEPLSKGDHTIAVDYTGKIQSQAYGLFAVTYPTEDGSDTMLATQFEPGDARRLAPMWDEPAKKAVFEISAIVDPDLMVISNGAPVQKTPEGDKVRVDFKPTPKMSSYLLFLGIGHFDRITDHAGDVELGIVARAGDGEKGRYAIEATKEILAAYNDYFGVDYPLEKLDQIAVPGAGGFGAMENWGAIMYFEQLLLLDPVLSGPDDRQNIFNVIAHEVAHQWFGDLVTMSWWDDLWLNEGYASWMQAKISAKLHPDRQAWLKSLAGRETAFGLDSIPSSHAIVQNVRNIDEANLAFDAITYQKGRAVIRMIEAYLGEDAFREGMRAYMKKHAYANTVTGDLWAALEKASKVPVRAIAADFTTQSGVPLIIIDSVRCEGGNSIATLHQGNFAADISGKDETKRWRTPVTASIAGSSDISRAIIFGPGAQTMTLKGCGAAKFNLGESAYFRTRYEDAEFKALLGAFARLNATDQLGLINDAFALGASGDAPYSRFIDIVEITPADADPVILSSITNNLVVLAKLFDGAEGEEDFRKFARGWLSGAFRQVGWTQQETELENERILRANLITALAQLGDEEVMKEAQRRFAAFRKDPASLPSDLVTPVIQAVGATADKKTFDQLVALARNAKSTRDARLYYIAAAGIRSRAFEQHAADMIFDAKTPSQFQPLLFGIFSKSHSEFGWDYYKANREKIDSLLDPLQRLRYPSQIAKTSNDAKTADDLESFARENLPDSANADVTRAAETIRANAAVREKRLPDIVKRLKSGAGS